MHNILTANEEYLKQLNSNSSVEFFRDLIWAEASRIGISPSKINISLRINVPDGGVDATIDAEDISLPSGGLFEEGKNSYQIKAGEGFRPQNKSAIQKELFDNKIPSIENLAPEARACLEQNGKYVIVCFGLDLIGKERRQALEHLNKLLEKCGFINPKIDIWSINNLRGFIQKYPALALRTNQLHDEPFRTHDEWSHVADMRVPFESGKEQQELIDNIRNQLHKNDIPSQLRILGEAGVGKTRLTLEATNIDDLRPLVVYALASEFDGSPLMTELIRNETLNAIVILDECDNDQRARFWNNLKFHYPRIKLISIYNDWDAENYDIIIYELTGLATEQISAIIQSYDVPKFEADRWAPDCGGSPRVAHVIGRNLRSNPEDVLKPPSNVNVWDRFIHGSDKADSENARLRRIVLQHIALFRRFGYERPLHSEAEAIHRLVQEADTFITWARFQEIVNQLKKQHILQGKTTLYITPRLLHVKLWIDWWDLHGDSFDIDRATQFPPRLIEWFLEMFEYAQGSPAASQKVKDLLGENGIFQENRGEFLKKGLGARFFYHLTLAEPAAALRCLQQTMGSWSREEMLSLDETRSLIVSSLAFIALWRELFPGAARLLLALGEAENQTYSNNASGTFTELFQLSEHKELSKSEAAPTQRIQVLREALNSKSREARRLGLEACKKALSWVSGGLIRDGHRVVGKKPDLWHPKTYGDLFNAYREIWKLLFSSLDYLDSEDQKIAYSNLVESAHNLARIQLLNEMVLKDLEALSQKEYAEKELLIATVVRFVHDFGKEIPPDVYDQWEKFQKKLTGGNYHDLLIRYIAMDLIYDKFDEAGNVVDKTEQKIRELADYGLSNQAELKAELHWLMSNDFYRARGFATEIGKKDKEKSLLPNIVQTAKELKGKRTAANFLGSYLEDSFVQDKNVWTNIVNTFAEDEDLVYVVPLVVWRSHELTNKLAVLLIRLVKAGRIDLAEFSLFEYGSFLKNISNEIVGEWFELLLSQNDIRFTAIALSTHHQLYIYGHPDKGIPEEITLQLLTHPSLFTAFERARYDQMAEHNWKEIAGRFIEQYPNHALELSKIVLDHFADDNILLGGIFSGVHNIVGKVAQLYPEHVWEQITAYLDPPYDRRAFGITHWLHGESELFDKESKSGPLDIFPPEIVWKWVNEDVDQRAWYLATFVPKVLHREKEKVCWARELLVRYGYLESVRNNLHANFGSGSWSGSASQYFARQQKKAIDFRKDESEPQVIRWLDEYIDRLEHDVQREKMREERDDF